MRDSENARGRATGPGEEMPPARSVADDTERLARPRGGFQPLTEDLEELADDLRCSRRHVEQMDRNGRLGPRAIKLGRRRVWVREEVREWLAAGAPDRVKWLAMGGART